MDTKCQTRRCCLTIPSQPSRPGSPALPPEILCCIINISPRVGVNGPMLKLTFISFIHPAKSAAMKRILAHKNVHLKMPCDSHCAEALMTLLLTRRFRIHAWDISSEICWFYQDGEKAAEADIWSFHTINHQQVRELRILFHPLNNVRTFKLRQKLLEETQVKLFS